MTCAEFEQKYPDIAEGENEVSRQLASKKCQKSKPSLKASASGGWSKSKQQQDSNEEDVEIESDDAEEVDESSSYRA